MPGYEFYCLRLSKGQPVNAVLWLLGFGDPVPTLDCLGMAQLVGV